jgi:acetyl-CoA carboxylase biotin carboxyl carrier protein
VRFGGRNPPPAPDPDLIRSLAALLAETGLTEIEYAVGNCRIRVSRAAVATTSAFAASPTAAPAPEPQQAPDLAGAVTAPIVGTVYLAAQPGAAPFVRLGDSVVEGQPLLIIEAMKVMNEIRSPRAGRIAQILVADAQPVEFGMPLMLIE